MTRKDDRPPATRARESDSGGGGYSREQALEFEGRYSVDAFELEARLSVERGEFVALVGPNGSGKSTMLRLIAGLAALDHGRIAIDGQVVDDAADATIVAAEHRGIGFVFQKPLLFAHLNVRDNVAYGLRSRVRSRRDARRHADELLADLGIAALADRKPDQLSGGQAQRVAFTRALAPQPPLLLLDEPFSALDPGAAVAVRSWLAEQLARSSTTTLAVLHEESAVHQFADRIIALNAGCITADTRPLPPSDAVVDLMAGQTPRPIE